MLYEVDGEKIYSYVYSEFLTDINPNTKDALCAQYEKARKENKVVLFIRDRETKKLKSYTI